MRSIITLVASHICNVLSKEDVAYIVEFGLNRTSVIRSECPSEELTKSNVSMFQIKTCQRKTPSLLQ